MSNKVSTLSDSYFWSLQGRYSSFALQRVKTHLEKAGHRGIAFHYQLISMGLLLKTFQRTPRLQEIITCFEGAYSFDRKTAFSSALRQAREVNLEGLREMAILYAETNLQDVNEEAYRYWRNTLQRLEQHCKAITQDTRQGRTVAKFLVKYYTLKSQVRRMETDFTVEQIRIEAAKSRASVQGERDNEAIEAIGQRLYPELFINEHQDKSTAHMEKATTNVDVDAAAPELDRHEWLGTQKELAELFIELERKGWIRKKKETVIQASFTKSNTIGQILKPNKDHKYPEVFKPNYKPKFDAIKSKPAAKRNK